MMKVLLDGLMVGSGSGGDMRYIMDLAAEMSKSKNFEPIMAILPHGEQILKASELSYIKLSGLRVEGPVLLHRAAKKVKPQIIHTQYFPVPFFGGNVVTTIHDVGFLKFPQSYSHYQRIKLRTASRLALKTSDAIVTVSNFSYRHLVELYPKYKSKIVVVPNGVDLDKYTIATSTSRKPYILWVGNTEPRKNFQNLL